MVAGSEAVTLWHIYQNDGCGLLPVEEELKENKTTYQPTKRNNNSERENK